MPRRDYELEKFVAKIVAYVVVLVLGMWWLVYWIQE